MSCSSSAAGAIANTYTYDSFGKLTASTGSITNRFQYTAREFDSESGLYYYRARYYDPSTGRFLSEDPSHFAGGINYYDYTMNSSTGWTDPTGLGLSPEQCAKLLESILKRVELLEKKLGKYDPITDGVGGAEYSAGGEMHTTQPGSHFAAITGLQISILYDVKRYKDQCQNGPKIPCEVYKPLTRKIPAPVIPKTMEELRLDEESARYMEKFWLDIALGGAAIGAVLTAPATGPGGILLRLGWAF
jgi:RHS repeat-associated protein